MSNKATQSPKYHPDLGKFQFIDGHDRSKDRGYSQSFMTFKLFYNLMKKKRNTQTEIKLSTSQERQRNKDTGCFFAPRVVKQIHSYFAADYAALRKFQL